jgi:tryptophan halogenase
MLGQGIVPQDYHPIANTMSDEKLTEMLAKVKEIKHAPVDKLPSHDEFLKMFCRQ